MRYAMIMAGGAGTRFWPESRADRPKQLLPLANGIIVTSASHPRATPPLELARRHVPTLDRGDHFIGRRADSRRIVKEARDVEQHKCNDDNGKAPLEPSLVPTHAVEHRHQ